MMTGDSYRVPLQINTNEGLLTVDALADLEVFIGSIRKVLSKEEIEFDSEKNCFLVYMSQKETFRLRGKEKVQARCKFKNGEVVGVDFGELDVSVSTSKVVL